MDSVKRPFRIRPINRTSDYEINLVAARMRATLAEVLGRKRGEEMYSMDWLVDRARFHLDPTACNGEILVAESSESEIGGHAILRAEGAPEDQHGLLSTIYVAPDFRRQGMAHSLIEASEFWCRELGMNRIRTNTHPGNDPLIRLLERCGFTLVETVGEFAVLVKHL